MQRGYTAPPPTRMHLRVDTPRLSWLHEQNGKEEVFGCRRNRQREERTPLLAGGCGRLYREQRRRHERNHARRCDWRTSGRGITSFCCGGAAAVCLCLADVPLGGMIVTVRFVQRTGRAAHAAR